METRIKCSINVLGKVTGIAGKIPEHLQCNSGMTDEGDWKESMIIEKSSKTFRKVDKALLNQSNLLGKSYIALVPLCALFG